MSDVFEWPNGIDPPVLFANNQWVVTNSGIECLTKPYAIERTRINERRGCLSEWVLHLGEKKWVDIHEFCEVLEQALVILNIKGRTYIDITASKNKALKDRSENADFSRFVDGLMGGNVGAQVISGSDLQAAGELYNEARRRR